MSLGTICALLSLLLVVGVVAWNNTVRRPPPPAVERAIAFAGMLAAAGAFALEPGTMVTVVAGLGLAVSAFLFLLTFLSELPDQRVAVSVGHPAPDFRAHDAEGNEFRLSGLRGSAVVLKFYRGTWCPYCVAELRQWNEHAAELRALGLKLVAVSHDSEGELRRFKLRNRWNMALLADPDLEVIRRYNLQNRNFTPKRGPFRDMAIPVTVLIGADGRVLWLELATDFRLRSPAGTTLAAMRAVLRADADQEPRVRSDAGPSHIVPEKT